MSQRLSRSAKTGAFRSPAQVLRQATRSVIEALEKRQLLSCSYDAGTRTLTVTGSDDPDYGDTIAVAFSDQDGKLTVTVNGNVEADPYQNTVDRLVINGGAGGDIITINESVPDSLLTTIYGGDGDDSITGDNGAQTISGGNGNDTISDGAGNDRIYGDAGTDSIIAGWGRDTISGGAGIDTIDYSNRSGGVRILLTGATTSGDIASSENDVIGSDVEWAEGTDYADYIVGNPQANTLNGNAGNDTIIGNLGADSIDAGDGADLVYGGLDSLGYDQYGNPLPDTDAGDTIRGGSGNDTIYGNAGDDDIYGDDGNDLIYGGYGNDEIDCGADNDTAYGGYGVDTIHGQGGNDYLLGDDDLTGDGGPDTLYAGPGADTLNGGAGDDTFILYQDGALDVINGGDGWDIVQGTYDNGTPYYDVFYWIEAFQ